MKTITIKFQVTDSITPTTCKTVQSACIAMNGVLKGLIQYHTVSITENVDLMELQNTIYHEYKEDVEIRKGVSGGCYGMRDGKSYQGLTVYCDSSLVETRFVDGEFNEVVNIEQLCNEHGTKLEVEDADSIREAFEALGIEGKSDNTYNYLGNNYDEPITLCDADFTLYQQDECGAAVVIIKFHCGGDVRGNYTDEVVYKFEDMDELWSALYPRLQYINEDHATELAELRDQLWKLKGKKRQALLNKMEGLAYDSH